MSTTGNLVQIGGIPECNETWNELLTNIIAAVQVQIPTAVSYVIQSSVPSVSDQDKLWVKLVGGYLEGSYAFNNGIWARPHPIAASSEERKIFVGSSGSIDTYDGGEVATVGDATGPFWEIATEFEARMPLGVGTLPISTTVVAVTAEGGADKHTLAADELPEHTHDFKLNQYALTDSSNPPPNQLLASNTSPVTAGGTAPDVTIDGGGDGQAHDNMPPYIGVYFIKRTARIYHRGA